MAKKYIPMAIAYDFDGTLARGNMQEHQFLPDIGMKPSKFWEEVHQISKDHQADEVLAYMNLMLKKAQEKKVPVRREDFKARGRDIPLFDGVEDWFFRITHYARTKGVRIEHFLISSGNDEIFRGTKIARKFKAIFASKFMFDHNGVAQWPALAINYTTKTQFLFRINKGAYDLSDNAKVNEYVPLSERTVPFENMIFVGDGATDVPCFRTVKELGGLSIAVYQDGKRGAKAKAEKYMRDGRVHAVVLANYAPDSLIERIVKLQIDQVAAREALSKALKRPGVQ